MAEEVVVRTITGKVGSSYAVPTAPVTIYDLFMIRKRKDVTSYTIPFGPARGKKLLREAGLMDWKLERGKDFEEVAKKHGALLEGNQLARAISMKLKGTKGVTIGPDGHIYPKKALMQKKWRELFPDLAEWYEKNVKPKAKKYKPKKYLPMPTELARIVGITM